MAATDAVGFQNQFNQVVVRHAVQGHRAAFFKAHRHLFGFDHAVVFPERHAHDGVDDLHAAVQKLQVFGFVGCTEHVAVSAVGLLGAHLVAEAVLRHEGAHLRTATQFVDESLVQPRLINFQRGVGQQAVAVEALDVIALERRAVAPDVHIVLLHGADQHGAGHGAAQRRGVEVGDAGGGDVEGTALQRGQPFSGQLRAAIHQTGFFCAVFHRLAGDFVVISLVGLAQVGGVSVGQGTLEFHPVQGRAGVQATRECDTNLLADGGVLQNGV